MREHVRCPRCEGCLTCGIHTAGVTCNGTLTTPQLIIRSDLSLTDDQVAELRERFKAALENPGYREEWLDPDGWACTPGCPDDTCRSMGTCVWASGTAQR